MSTPLRPISPSAHFDIPNTHKGLVFIDSFDEFKRTLQAFANRLESQGYDVLSSGVASRRDPSKTSVVVIEADSDASRVATEVESLVTRGWQVVAALPGPSPAVDAALQGLEAAGLISIEFATPLSFIDRLEALAATIPSVDRSAIELLARCTRGALGEIEVRAALFSCRSSLRRGGSDRDIAMVVLRGDHRAAREAPVPRTASALLSNKQTLKRVHTGVLREVALRSRSAVAITAFQGMTESGGNSILRAENSLATSAQLALNLSLNGFKVLWQTHRTMQKAVGQLVAAANCTPPFAVQLIRSLPIAILADGAASSLDFPSTIERCSGHTDLEPEVGVLEVLNLDEIGALVACPLPTFICAPSGAIAPAEHEVWEIAGSREPFAWRMQGGTWSYPFLTLVGEVYGQEVDETGALRGWRLWGLTQDAAGFALSSPIRSKIWERGVMTSECSRHEVPNSDCHCGIYAFTSLEEALRESERNPNLLIGELRAWGSVAIHSKGFRAHTVQVVRLWPNRMVDQTVRQNLIRRYECNIESVVDF